MTSTSTVGNTSTTSTGLSAGGIGAIAGSIGAVFAIATVSTALFLCYRVRVRTKANIRMTQLSYLREPGGNNEREAVDNRRESLSGEPSRQYPGVREENVIDCGRTVDNLWEQGQIKGSQAELVPLASGPGVIPGSLSSITPTNCLPKPYASWIALRVSAPAW